MCFYVLESILSKVVVWYHGWHTSLDALPSVTWPVEQLNFPICFTLSFLGSNEAFSRQNFLQYWKTRMFSLSLFGTELLFRECTRGVTWSSENQQNPIQHLKGLYILYLFLKMCHLLSSSSSFCFSSTNLSKLVEKLHDSTIFTWGRWRRFIVDSLFVPFIPGCKFVFFLPQTFQGFGEISESQYFQKLETCFF